MSFIDTQESDAFVSSGMSRETSEEIMKAIAFFARNLNEAESLWEGDGIGEVATLTDIQEKATGNGRIADDDLMWGGRTLATILAENAHHVALFGGSIIGEAATREGAISIASPNGAPFNVDFYDSEDGPRVQGYDPDGKGVWIVDPA